MPIKQIQLRGISRTPSDRMTADGGLAESLNVHIDEQETAPSLPAEDITNRYGSNASSFVTGPALFVHKGQGYENLLYLSSGAIRALPKSTQTITTVPAIYTLQTGEEILDVTSVGNTVLVCTNQRVEYLLYKDGTYTDLGDRIPVPMIEFQTREYYSLRSIPSTAYEVAGLKWSDTQITLIDNYTPRSNSSGGSSGGSHSGGGSSSSYVPRSEYDGLKGWNTNTWSRYLAGEIESDEYDASYNEIVTDIWDMIQKQIPYVKQEGLFPCPVFARYALRLYDGTYIYQSVPILLGGGTEQFVIAFGSSSQIPDGREHAGEWKSQLNAFLSKAYKVKAYLKQISYAGWEDIVKSIDLFISTDIHIPALHSKITGVTQNSTASTSTYHRYDISFADSDADLNAERIREEILSKSQFYKIETFKIGETSKLENGYDLLTRRKLLTSQDVDDADLSSQDNLVEQEELPDDYRSSHKITAEYVFRYNNKVIMTGIGQEMTSGYPYLNGSVVRAEFGDTANQQEDIYSFIFFLRGPSNEDIKVYGRSDEGSTSIEPYSQQVIAYYYGGGATYTHYAKPMGWLAYPDSRCYQVYVKRVTGNVTKYISYKMEPHPRLECSFVYIGLENQLANHASGIGTDITSTQFNAALENKSYKEDNVLWSSLMNNPFVFLASGRLTFYSRVIAVASATQALSEGQFGQFPLYVFTEDGIWTVPIFDAGDFAAALPLSRDVAVSRKAVQNVEQAIVFVTAQGVMLLEGSSVQNISPNMNGKHYVMEESAEDILEESAWADLVAIENDTQPFMSFVKSSRIGYDYAGKRLIFFVDGKSYQYVYHLKTQTWHKLLNAHNSYRVLNSYPDCYVSVEQVANNSSSFKLMNFTTVLDDNSVLSDTEHPVKGLVITRPFDLGEPDIRKAIKSIRVRGQFNRNDVKYVLLGSFDGINWQLLTSLRGGSYKLFRMILLCNLTPMERISWIDVDYESRFANRLR